MLHHLGHLKWLNFYTPWFVCSALSASPSKSRAVSNRSNAICFSVRWKIPLQAEFRPVRCSISVVLKQCALSIIYILCYSVLSIILSVENKSELKKKRNRSCESKIRISKCMCVICQWSKIISEILKNRQRRWNLQVIWSCPDLLEYSHKCCFQSDKL